MTEFEQWFSSEWLRTLRAVPNEPGLLSSGLSLQSASWDRRAGFLLWDAMGRPRAPWREQMAPLYDAPKPAVAPPDADDTLADLLG